MIFGKLWRSLQAQLNKLANFFSGADPIAEMQYEYDKSVEELKQGRLGLEQYRALVERVARQVANDEKHVRNLDGKVKAYLQSGNRETAARFALELQKARQEMAENQTQLDMHEKSYQNNLTKIKHASEKLGKVREKIAHYDSDLKMSRAEAELSQLARSFNFDITTDFGQIEQTIQDKIGLNRAKARVAADLSVEGLEEIEQERAVEDAMAEDALRDFEIEMGLVTPQTGGVQAAEKQVGPSVMDKKTQSESL